MENRTRFIIPFYFDTTNLDFDDLENRDQDHWELSKKDSQESDLYEYITDSLLRKDYYTRFRDNILGAVYKYKGRRCSFRHEYYTDTENKENKSDIGCAGIGLYLFASGIGFLWMELKINDNRIIVDFVNEFKEMVRSDSRISTIVTKDIDKDTVIPENYIFKNDKIYKVIDKTNYRGYYVREILNTLKCDITFIPSRNTQKGDLPDKAIIFNHVKLDEKDFEETAYRLTRGYNRNYIISDSEYDNMMHPFGNVILFATGEGCGYYVKGGKEFVDGSKIMSDYFTLYILALYQTYSLLRISEKIASDMPTSPDMYDHFSKKIHGKLKMINTDLNVFMAKSIYSSVSFVQHQNNFYNYIIKELRIREDIESISSGIVALRDMQTNLEKDVEEKRERIINGILTFLAALGILQSFSAILDIISFFNK
ncbi:MAG: hypothetical protein K5888_10005 [Lachnospiraceae bacterium]|nr:hypothetical protein [Lachnospiraceae bacterium]